MSPIAPLLVGLDAEILPDGVVVVKDVNGEDDGQEEREAADAAVGGAAGGGRYKHLCAITQQEQLEARGEGCKHLMKSVTASCASKYVSHMNVIMAPHTHACHANTARVCVSA